MRSSLAAVAILLLVAVGCGSAEAVGSASPAPEGSVAPAESVVPLPRGVLPIDVDEVVLVDRLCPAAALLVAAEEASRDRSMGDFDLIDAAVTEWELRLYGLRYAARKDPGVAVSDSVTIFNSTLVLGRIDRRTGWVNYLPPTPELIEAARDLREVMLRVCPTEWAAEFGTKVIAEW